MQALAAPRSTAWPHTAESRLRSHGRGGAQQARAARAPGNPMPALWDVVQELAKARLLTGPELANAVSSCRRTVARIGLVATEVAALCRIPERTTRHTTGAHPRHTPDAAPGASSTR